MESVAGSAKHKPRRIEGADEILPFRQVDAGFAADGAIDLSDERGRHVNNSDAAQVAGGDKSGNVSDHTSSRSHQNGAAISPRAN